MKRTFMFAISPALLSSVAYSLDAGRVFDWITRLEKDVPKIQAKFITECAEESAPNDKEPPTSRAQDRSSANPLNLRGETAIFN